ncbi:MAG: class I adenylate-forming enzyme family protein [Halobacteriales archaeon]
MAPHTAANGHTVGELSSLAAAGYAAETAFVDTWSDESCSWAEFDERSVRAANAVRASAGQGDRVAFLCAGSVDHVTLWNGALKAGCVVSNLHTRGAPETARYCIDELSPQVVVVDESVAEFYREAVHDRVSTAVGTVVVIGEADRRYEESASSFVADRDDTPPDTHVAEDDLAAVMWTSGTTGRPKGWCFTHRGLLDRGMKLLSAGDHGHWTRRLQGLMPAFAAWYSGVLPAMLARSATYFVREWDPERYLELIEEHDLTRLTLVPTMWQELLRVEGFDTYDLGSLSVAGTAGERLTAETLRRLREDVCERVVNSYAATESVATFVRHDAATDAPAGTVGRPTSLTDVRVVTPDGAPDETVPTGETGELIVRTTDQPVWAWNDTERTRAAFVDGWWYSGDLGYRDADGYLYLEGRTDFAITSKGIQVHPGPVEERLTDHPAVDEAAVVGVEDDEYGERVTALVYAPDADPAPAELDQWCLDDDGLARHERPRAYAFVEDPLPRTVTGKLDRTAARDRLTE